jgi:hypothetical protein
VPEASSRRLAIGPGLCDPGLVQRAVLLVFLALLTFNVSGLAAICEEATCDETCPTDVSGGQCPPNCHYCDCCSLPRAANSSCNAALVAPTARDSSWIRSSHDLTSPEPADILHVPRPFLA